MKKIILNLRHQPEGVKKHILHISTIVAGIVLILLWIYSLGTSLISPDIEAKAKEDLKPFSALKENLVGGFKSISE